MSDVVIENFRFGVMEKLGLGYDVLREIRPDLIMVSMPAFGRTGPERSYVAYGINQEQLSGIAGLTGYRGEGPMKSGINIGDPLAGLHTAGVILAALRHRQRTGEGQFIEVAQLETIIPLIGEYIVAYGMNQRIPERLGNRHPLVAPHGCYPCRGEDAWVVLAAFSDDDFTRLAEVIGQPQLVADARLSSNAARYRHQDELDAIIASWTRTHTPREAMEKLQAAGIAAGVVLNTREVIEDPHIRARSFFQYVEHPETGYRLYPGIPIVFSRTSFASSRHAPLLGEHNAPVLQGLLGVTPDQYTELERRHVIGTVPLQLLQEGQNTADDGGDLT